MPIYEYHCSVCEVRFDKMRPISRADEPAPCPTCQLLAGRCASVFAAHGSDGRALAGSNGGGCASCATHNCASCARPGGVAKLNFALQEFRSVGKDCKAKLNLALQDALRSRTVPLAVIEHLGIYQVSGLGKDCSRSGIVFIDEGGNYLDPLSM